MILLWIAIANLADVCAAIRFWRLMDDCYSNSIAFGKSHKYRQRVVKQNEQVFHVNGQSIQHGLKIRSDAEEGRTAYCNRRRKQQRTNNVTHRVLTRKRELRRRGPKDQNTNWSLLESKRASLPTFLMGCPEAGGRFEPPYRPIVFLSFDSLRRSSLLRVPDRGCQPCRRGWPTSCKASFTHNGPYPVVARSMNIYTYIYIFMYINIKINTYKYIHI